MGKLVTTFKTGVKDFLDDECMSSAAALAYYTIFSLPPLLVLVFFVAGLFNVPHEQVSDVVRRQLGMPVPSQLSAAEESDQLAEKNDGTAAALQDVARRQGRQSDPVMALGPISKGIGIAILIFSATGVFVQLQRALNRAWEVEPDPEAGGWKGLLAKRGSSLGMIVVMAFLLLVSLVLTTLVEELMSVILGHSPGVVGLTVGILVNNAVALVVATALFAAVFKVLPDAELRWADLWRGALITAVLFVLGKAGLGWYLQNSKVGSSWGSAAASMIALLVWVYYTSLIVLLGAELTQAWVAQHGAGIEPAQGAVRVVRQKERIREQPQSNGGGLKPGSAAVGTR